MVDGDTLQDRVRRFLISAIEQGVWKPGQRLPTEKQIAATLNVSLAPVRIALGHLAAAGMIDRQAGRGTFVRDMQIHYRLEGGRSCTDSLRAQGIDFTVQVVKHEVGAPSERARELLQIDGSGSLLRADRLFSIRDTPGILLSSWTVVPAGATPPTAQYLAEGGSIYAWLNEQGVVPTRRSYQIEAHAVEDVAGRLLNLPTSAPILKVRTKALDADGLPWDASEIHYVPSYFSIEINSQLAPPTATAQPGGHLRAIPEPQEEH